MLCVGTRSLGGIPSANAKVLVLSIYLPTKGDEWPKATSHENACLLSGENLDYHCHCPPKNPDDISGNRRDRDTLTTGPTHSTVAPALEG